eukprot:bmy_06195T0
MRTCVRVSGHISYSSRYLSGCFKNNRLKITENRLDLRVLLPPTESAATGFLPVVRTLLTIQVGNRMLVPCVHARQLRSAANRKGPSKDDTYWKEINAAMALTNLAQGKDKLQGTTSCIIQKSSHIAEVKTVKVPLVQQF